MTRGGVHAFEHRWAMGKAFEFHREIGKGRVQGRDLEEHRIIASTTPYSPSYARFTAGLLNDEAEVERCLAAVHAMR